VHLVSPLGQDNDAFSMLKSLPSGQFTPSITSLREGQQYTEYISKEVCVKYLHDNFEENTIVFSPIYQIDKSLNCGLAAKTERISKTKPCFVLRKVNFYKHLKSFGFTKEDIQNRISHHLSNEENCIVVYPPRCNYCCRHYPGRK